MLAHALACRSKFDFEWPVNLAVAGPCGGAGGTGGGSLVAMVGDYPESCVVDLRSNARVATLAGHLDFTFAAAWHPDQPHTLATGNQARPRPPCVPAQPCTVLGQVDASLYMNTTHMIGEHACMAPTSLLHLAFGCQRAQPPARSLPALGKQPRPVRPVAQDTSTRVWDLRKPSESVAVLCGNMGAVRSLRFSPDGRVLAAAEPADFVRLYDVAAGYSRCSPALPPGMCGDLHGQDHLLHVW